MHTSRNFDVVDQDRRRLLGTAAMGIAVTAAAGLFPAGLASASDNAAIRSFRVNVPESKLVDLRRRITAAQWPEQETVADNSQGVRLVTMRQLAHYWQSGYDWRKVEARLNDLPRSSSPRSMESISISFTSVPRTCMRCRSS
jgi:hypothetical protein